MKIPPRPFITFGSIIHVALTIHVILRYADCKYGPCVPLGYQVASKALSFPLGLLALLWRTEADPITNATMLWGSLSLILNSVLATAMLWWLLNWTTRHLSKRSDAVSED